MTYELNVSIPYNLYKYYTMQNHFLFSPADFPKFVTPYTFQPIADRLWQIYNNTEDFTNGVLMLVHQITYEEIAPGKYPVETLANGKGDCDLFAYIAASILKAGGISVILLYYKDKLHMQIGVTLDSPPVDARTPIYSVNYQNASYYIAECTGGNWRYSWRIGECPTDYQNVSSQVVTLENTEKISTGQVAATLRELDPSMLALQISPPLIVMNNLLVISGQILPQTANENVTLQTKSNRGDWTTIATVETQADGKFTYNWIPSTEGVHIVQASWVGNRQLNGATSASNNVFVLSYSMVLIILAVLLGGAIAVLAWAAIRRKKPLATVQPPTH